MKPYILAWILILFAGNNSFGCMCVRGITTKSSYTTSEVVINAIIIASKNLSETSITSDNKQIITLKGIEYRAVVIQQYKGHKTSDTITIDPLANTSCEMPFNIGGNYLIFASRAKDNSYSTGMCAGNKPYNKKDHQRLLRYQRRSSK